MTGDKRIQRAGDNSTQTFVETQIIGISEDRANEIAKKRAEIAVREQFELEAAAIAHKRITRADQKIIAKLTAQELLDSFAEPAFLSAFQKAQIGAAQTDEEEDYDILANLLVERAIAVANPVKSATLKAIEVVNLVDESALRGLTGLWAITSITPITEEPAPGLRALDDLYTRLVPSGLPSGTSWVGHLDSLNIVRENDASKFKPLADIILQNCTAWACRGYTESEMAVALDAIESVTRVRFGTDSIRDHSYREGYFRFRVPSRLAMLETIEQNMRAKGETLSENDRVRLEEILVNLHDADEESKEKFSIEMAKYEQVNAASNWLSNIDHHIRITPIGKALAYTNAKRFDPLDGLSTLSQTLTQD